MKALHIFYVRLYGLNILNRLFYKFQSFRDMVWAFIHTLSLDPTKIRPESA